MPRPLFYTIPGEYTGPLSVTAASGYPAHPHDTGSHVIVLLGLAVSYEVEGRPIVRARMEMTPEEAEDLSSHLASLARIAKGVRA